MKHAGRARRAALKLIFLTLAGAAILGAIAMMVQFQPQAVSIVLAALWAAFTLFTFYFFRDPDARTPGNPGVILSPGHGTVDCIDKLEQSDFPGGPCHRISIFLSVLNVHVQCAPVSGMICRVAHTDGNYISALNADSAKFNENVLIGFDSAEVPGEKIGVRLIAGVLARRIIPFVKAGDQMARGERISLIQFGSRCDVYIPLSYAIKVKLQDPVVGGETILAAK
jgi:phosphatidylserine decarboxylase